MTGTTPSLAAPSAAPPESTAPPGGLQRHVLRPPTGWQPVDLAELWRYRELTWFLALRDIKVRYKQTVLGAAWAVIQPVMSTLVFTVFFNKLAGVTSIPGVPYVVATFCAMLPWQLYETSLTQAGNSLVGSQNLITKVYFPRLTIPISSVLVGLLDFVIGLVLLVMLMAWYHITPGWAIMTLPLFTLMALVLALGVGLWLSALNVQYRDVRYALPFLTRIWFFATPVVYPASEVAKKFGSTWEAIYGLNPMAGVVEGFRWSMLGTSPPSVGLLSVSAVATVLLLIGGLYYFRRMEQTFADIV